MNNRQLNLNNYRIERDEKIKAWYTEGFSLEVIAEEFDLSKVRIFQILQNFNLIPRKFKKYKKENFALFNQIESLNEQGMTQAEISNQIGFSRQRIQQILSKELDKHGRSKSKDNLIENNKEELKLNKQEYMKEYHSRPEVKARLKRRKKEKMKDPVYLETLKEKRKEYHSRPEVIARTEAWKIKQANDSVLKKKKRKSAKKYYKKHREEIKKASLLQYYEKKKGIKKRKYTKKAVVVINSPKENWLWRKVKQVFE